MIMPHGAAKNLPKILAGKGYKNCSLFTITSTTNFTFTVRLCIMMMAEIFWAVATMMAEIYRAVATMLADLFLGEELDT